jgi:hypothetical protein
MCGSLGLVVVKLPFGGGKVPFRTLAPDRIGILTIPPQPVRLFPLRQRFFVHSRKVIRIREYLMVGASSRIGLRAESKIMKITPDGKRTTVYIGFTTVLGLAFDAKGRLYVLENTTGNPGPMPNTATILRVNGKNNYTVIADGATSMLSLPTAMTFGPDGNLYVSNLGFGLPPDGEGQVLKITLTD